MILCHKSMGDKVLLLVYHCVTLLIHLYDEATYTVQTPLHLLTEDTALEQVRVCRRGAVCTSSD